MRLCLLLFFSLSQAAALDLHLELASEENIPNNLMYIELNIDVNKMAQVVRNLMSNALKFTPRGGSVKLFASYTKHTRNADGTSLGTVRVEIHDSGMGIKPVITCNYLFLLSDCFQFKFISCGI